MGEELTKLMNQRAADSKDAAKYVHHVKELYKLMELSDEEFIKEMKW